MSTSLFSSGRARPRSTERQSCSYVAVPAKGGWAVLTRAKNLATYFQIIRCLMTSLLWQTALSLGRRLLLSTCVRHASGVASARMMVWCGNLHALASYPARLSRFSGVCDQMASASLVTRGSYAGAAARREPTHQKPRGERVAHNARWRVCPASAILIHPSPALGRVAGRAGGDARIPTSRRVYLDSFSEDSCGWARNLSGGADCRFVS